MATQSQVNQLIARLVTKLKPATLDHDRLQAFLGDPEALDRFAAEFIGTYERRTYPAIEITGIVEPTFPDWSKGRVLNGDIRRPKEIDFLALMASAYFHSRQTGEKHKDNRPLGHEILASLVASYKAGEDKVGNTYDVSETDLIHGHFGIAELTYMEKNWSTLPEPFKAWAKGKLLYGWRDIVRTTVAVSSSRVSAATLLSPTCTGTISAVRGAAASQLSVSKLALRAELLGSPLILWTLPFSPVFAKAEAGPFHAKFLHYQRIMYILSDGSR